MQFLNKDHRLNTLLLAGGIIGAVFILFGDKLSWFTFDISAADKISSLVLWITAVAVFWYTRATYDLKELAREDLEFARETQRSEFLPIIAPLNLNGIIQGGAFKREVKV
jgi:hypothetical protein